MNIRDKVIFVTGATGGIGTVICDVLTGYGAKVILASRNYELSKKYQQTLAEKGHEAFAVPLDVTDEDSVKNAVDTVAKKYGTIDVLVNNAGIDESGLLAEFDTELWDRTMDVNLRGPFLLSREVAKVMIPKRYGRIINISSMASVRAEYANGAYCISKAGLNMLTEILGVELGQYNITSCAISLGYTDTQLLRDSLAERAPKEGMTYDQYFESLLSTVPLGRLADPKELGELVAMLSDDRTHFMNGNSVLFTGGRVTR